MNTNQHQNTDPHESPSVHWMTFAEAAAELGQTRVNLYQASNNLPLPSARIGSTRVINRQFIAIAKEHSRRRGDRNEVDWAAAIAEYLDAA